MDIERLNCTPFFIIKNSLHTRGFRVAKWSEPLVEAVSEDDGLQDLIFVYQLVRFVGHAGVGSRLIVLLLRMTHSTHSIHSGYLNWFFGSFRVKHIQKNQFITGR
jgi:hypothetical protein